MKLCFFAACLMYLYPGTPLTAYNGNNMLNVLGQSTSSQTFKEFTKYWLLDKANENRALGIKINPNPISDKVESIIITGEVVDLGDLKFKKCTAKLPFGLSLDDDTSMLSGKLGHGEKLLGRTTMRYKNGNVMIEATYNNLKSGKITELQFSTAAGQPAMPSKTVNAAKNENKAVKPQPASHNTTTATAPKPKENIALTPFKKALLEVFKVSRDSGLEMLKTDIRHDGNFWNYKYTYNTRITVPGQKYNMLYSFPFVTSQLDFVVVLKESDYYEKSFETMYRDFERQLAVNFPPSEGWIATCLPGKDKGTLPNLEFRNDKYGAIIMDHSKNPAGRHVLYLRFLLFSD